MSQKPQVHLLVKQIVPYGYAIYLQECFVGQDPLLLESPVRMDLLEEDNWFLEIQFDNQANISSAQTTLFTYKFFVASWDNKQDIHPLQECFINSCERSIQLSNLQKFYLERLENPQSNLNPNDIWIEKKQIIILDIFLNNIQDISQDQGVFVIQNEKTLNSSNILKGKRLKKINNQQWQTQLNFQIAEPQEDLNFIFFKSFYNYRSLSYSSLIPECLVELNQISQIINDHKEELKKQSHILRSLYVNLYNDKIQHQTYVQEYYLKKENKQQKQKNLLEQEKVSKQVLQNLFLPANNISNISISNEAKAVIVPYLQKLNPQTSQIDDQQIKFFSQYKATQKSVEKPPEEIKKMEQVSQQTLLQIEKKYQNKQLDNNSTDLVMAGLYNMYRAQGFKVQLTDKSIPLTEEDKVTDIYQSQMILTGQTSNMKYLQLTIQDSQNLSFDQIEEDNQKKNEFINRFLIAASQLHQVPKEQIQIIDISKGSINVKYRFTSLDQKELDNVVQQGNQVFQQHFAGPLTLDTKSFIDNLQIRPDMLSPNHNMYWGDNFASQVDYRGSIKLPSGQLQKQQYKFPVGYFGFGLNVQKWLNNDKQWFGADSNPSTWIVLFH
ncbi:hypothetical protein ABPG72_002036 [Tetrahymena utriculariae]